VAYEPLMVPKEPMLLTLKETAVALRLGRSKLYELMAAGKLRSSHSLWPLFLVSGAGGRRARRDSNPQPSDP
jgi:hypothetical protein